MTYLLLKTLHLLAAMAFVGSLFFQVLILWPATSRLPSPERAGIAQAIAPHARKMIHWVALVLFCAGLGLVWPYRHVLTDPLASTFSFLLALKICLALVIVGHYMTLVLLRRGQRIGERGMRWLNISLLLHAVALVVCAKAMFML